jgi:hypothetical protein
MSVELAPRFVIHPITGEQLSLDSPDAQLAGAVEGIRTLESQLKDVKSAITREWLDRRDREASWTVHVPGVGKVSAPSPKPTVVYGEPRSRSPVTYDAGPLREALLALADEGLITMQAVDAAVEPVVTYEPRKKGITALLRLGGRVGATVSAFAQEAPEKARYLTVTRG